MSERTNKICRCCQQEYPVYGWDFYSLCQKHFEEFDMQKMQARFGSEGSESTEDVNKWLAAKGLL